MQTMILGAGGIEADPGAAASIRTGVLAVSAVLLKWFGRRDRYPEAGWLAYTVLVLGGLKLIFQDLPAGRPVTLFLSLTLYGGALWLVTRRRGSKGKLP